MYKPPSVLCTLEYKGSTKLYEILEKGSVAPSFGRYLYLLSLWNNT
jgi:hypothetical protein